MGPSDNRFARWGPAIIALQDAIIFISQKSNGSRLLEAWLPHCSCSLKRFITLIFTDCITSLQENRFARCNQFHLDLCKRLYKFCITVWITSFSLLILLQKPPSLLILLQKPPPHACNRISRFESYRLNDIN